MQYIAKCNNRWLSCFCPWVYLSERASNVKEFADNKLKSWLREDVQSFKYCRQISKGTNDEWCKPLRTNVHDVFNSRFYLMPIVLNSDPSLLDPTDKSGRRELLTCTKVLHNTNFDYCAIHDAMLYHKTERLSFVTRANPLWLISCTGLSHLY